jgi:hypothetical protein
MDHMLYRLLLLLIALFVIVTSHSTGLLQSVTRNLPTIQDFASNAVVAAEKFWVEHVQEPLGEMYATIRYDAHQFSFTNERYTSIYLSINQLLVHHCLTTIVTIIQCRRG